jgi:hypothetical protein
VVAATVAAVVVLAVVIVVYGWWWRCIDIYVFDGHRAVCFLAGFRNLIMQGRLCQNF